MIAIFTALLGSLFIPPIIFYYSVAGIKRVVKNPLVLISLGILGYFLFATGTAGSRAWYGNQAIHSLIIIIDFIFSSFLTEACIQKIKIKSKNKIFLVLIAYIIFLVVNTVLFFAIMNSYSNSARVFFLKSV